LCFLFVCRNVFFKDKQSSTMNGNCEIRIGGRHHRQDVNDDGVELVDISKKVGSCIDLILLDPAFSSYCNPWALQIQEPKYPKQIIRS
jgi:hypothetical protein